MEGLSTLGRPENDLPAEVALSNAVFHFSSIKMRLLSLHDNLERLSTVGHSIEYIVKMDHAYLDIRKIIEEIMMMSVSAHDGAGAVLSSKLRRQWNAEKAMKELEKLNPRFFPDAIDIHPLDEGDIAGRFVSVDDPYLTRKAAEDIYSYCGNVLHASHKPITPDILSQRYRGARNFDIAVRRLLETFEIDISGHGFVVFGHLLFDEPGPPQLFHAGVSGGEGN